MGKDEKRPKNWKGAGKIVILSTSTSTQIPNYKTSRKKKKKERSKQHSKQAVLDRGSWKNYKMFANPVFITPCRYLN